MTTSNRTVRLSLVSFLGLMLLVCVAITPAVSTAPSSSSQIDSMNSSDGKLSVDDIITDAVLTSSGVERVELSVSGDSISQSSVRELRDMSSIRSVDVISSSNTLVADVDLDTISWGSVLSKADFNSVILSDKIRAPSPKIETPTRISTQDADQPEIAYGVRQINADKAWEEFGTSGDGVKIAVIDGGVNVDHPSINLGGSPTDNYRGSYAFFDLPRDSPEGVSYHTGSDAPSPDENGLLTHGTHVAGIATGGDATGTQIGVAPNATLMQGVVAGEGENVWVGRKDIERAIRWAHNNDADVITVSFGGEINDPSTVGASLSQYTALVQDVRDNGTVYVNSAGNSGVGTGTTGGLNPEATAVGATNRERSVISMSSGIQYELSRSNWLPDISNGIVQPIPHDPSGFNETIIRPDFVAPGDSITSASSRGNFETVMTGTSMSAPHYAGSAAIVIQNNPKLTPQQVFRAHRATATDNPGEKGIRYGHGIIDTYEAVKVSKLGGYMTASDIRVVGSASPGESVTITTLQENENIFNQTATRNVTLRAGGNLVSKKRASVPPKTTTATQFNYSVPQSAEGSLQIVVSTEDDNLTRTIPVRENSQGPDAVEITHVDITPSTVPHPDGSSAQHVLDIRARGVSPDGTEDTITIELPNGIVASDAQLRRSSRSMSSANVSESGDSIIVRVNPTYRSTLDLTVDLSIDT